MWCIFFKRFCRDVHKLQSLPNETTKKKKKIWKLSSGRRNASKMIYSARSSFYTAIEKSRYIQNLYNACRNSLKTCRNSVA